MYIYIYIYTPRYRQTPYTSLSCSYRWISYIYIYQEGRQKLRCSRRSKTNWCSTTSLLLAMWKLHFTSKLKGRMTQGVLCWPAPCHDCWWVEMWYLGGVHWVSFFLWVFMSRYTYPQHPCMVYLPNYIYHILPLEKSTGIYQSHGCVMGYAGIVPMGSVMGSVNGARRGQKNLQWRTRAVVPDGWVGSTNAAATAGFRGIE